MAERKRPDEQQQEPKRQAEPGRTPGTAEGGTDDERRRKELEEPKRTPGSAEGGVVGPPRH